MTLLESIENHLKERRISATRFGREAVGDPRLVLDLRNGRQPRRKTVERLEAYLARCGREDRKGSVASLPVTDLPCAKFDQMARNGDSNPDMAGLYLQVAKQAARGGKAASRRGGPGDRS